MKRLVSFFAFAIILLFTAETGRAETTDDLKALRKEIDSLKEGQAAIRKDLQEIKNLLRAKQSPPPAEIKDIVLNIGDTHFRGRKNAAVTIVDFSDF